MSDSSGSEIEIKYDAGPDDELPDLSRLTGVQTVQRVDAQTLEAVYFDTEDLRLIGHGFTLRRRVGGDDQGWHLKIPTEEGRHEVRVPLSRAKVRVPKELRELVSALVGDDELGQVATVRTERTTQRLVGADDQVLAELADDLVTASSGDHETSWREWELELVDGDKDLLEEGAGLLAEAGANRSDASAKLVRALGDRLTEPLLPEPRKKGPAADLIRVRLAEQVRQLKRCDPAVRRDLPESVHDMRVASRRVRNALASYRPFLDRSVTEPLRDEVGWLADALGEARDAEVIRDRLVSVAEEQSDERLSVDGDWLRRQLDQRYRTAHRRLLDTLASPRYRELLGRLDALVAEPPWTEKAAKSVHKRVRKRALHDWDRFAGRMEAALALDGDADRSGSRAAALHAARKAGKRARYVLEPLQPLYGAPAERLVAALKDLQDELGDHHDTETARAELRRLPGETEDLRKAQALGVLHERERLEAARLEERAAAAWKKASARKLRRWLA